jgi:CheY-like chemotaxis protein
MQNIPENFMAEWDVVILDDEEDSLEVAEIILIEYGATVYTAVHGQAGLEMVRKVKPKLIISDLSMPVMDGWEFIEAMKKDRELAGIPTIALTAHAMPGDREKAIAAGFHNYLTKPLTVDTFSSDLVRILIDIPELSGYLGLGE